MTGPTTLQFDPNESWPGPRFSMGFGRIDTTLSGDYSIAYYTLVEPSGTRHYLGAGPPSVTSPQPGIPPPYPTYTTSDGSYISYVGDAVHGGELYYPNGDKYDINLVNNRLLEFNFGVDATGLPVLNGAGGDPNKPSYLLLE